MKTVGGKNTENATDHSDVRSAVGKFVDLRISDNYKIYAAVLCLFLYDSL